MPLIRCNYYGSRKATVPIHSLPSSQLVLSSSSIPSDVLLRAGYDRDFNMVSRRRWKEFGVIEQKYMNARAAAPAPVPFSLTAQWS